MKRNDGFTLVELIITLAIGTLVTLAATSTLLFGLRINAVTTNNVKQQNTIGMLNYALQSVAEQKSIGIAEEGAVLKDLTASGKEYIRYDAAAKVIYLNEAVFMENVDAFSAAFTNDQQQLTITMTTNGKVYTATTYCRLNPTPTPSPAPTPNVSPAPILDQGGTAQ